jgi:hypothetical protein
VADGGRTRERIDRIKADHEALNLASGYRGISIAPWVNLERGKNMPGE